MEMTTTRLEESVFPLVSKPNRYQSPFRTQDLPTFEEARARMCVIYPGPVETGLSRPGFHSFHYALSRAARPSAPALVDVAFAPAADLERELERRDLRLFGLGSRRPLSAYDLLVFLPDGMLDLPDLVAILARGGIPVRAARRGSGDPLVAVVGRVALAPGAASPFADAFAVGDPEAFAPDLVDAARSMRSGRDDRRETALDRLARTRGVLVPGRQPDGEPVVARWLSQPPAPSPAPFVPLVESSAGGLALELARPRGPEDHVDRPREARLRPLERVLRETEAALAASGHGEVVVEGAAARRPDLVALLEAMNQQFGPHGIQLRLEDVDPVQVEPALARELRKGRRARLGFGLLAPSARLREAVGRPLSRERLIEAAETAWRGGWTAVRFQVLLGLPGETAEDREEWAETLETIRGLHAKGVTSPKMSLEVVPFVPRPHTRWEREAPVDPDLYSESVAEWRRRLGRRKVKVSARSPQAAWTETALYRGGEAAASVVEEVSRAGGRRQADPELFDARAWETAWARLGPGDPAGGLRETTPWSHIVIDPPPSGRNGGSSPDRGAGLVLDEAEPGPGFGTPPWLGGRRPRRAGRGREGRQAERFRLCFSKSEPLRFTAHLDVTRAFERAFRRAQLPIALSRGKDRRPKVSFGPPLPLGMTSGAEYFDVTFAREVPEAFLRSLNQALPEGLNVTAAAPIRTEVESLNSALTVADYEVSFSDTLVEDHFEGMGPDELASRLERAVGRALAARSLEVTRVRSEGSRTFNARPSLLQAEVGRGNGGGPELRLSLTLNRPDSVRPELLTTVLCDWARFDERLLRVHRNRLQIPGRDRLHDPLDVVASGFAWWSVGNGGGTVL